MEIISRNKPHMDGIDVRVSTVNPKNFQPCYIFSFNEKSGKKFGPFVSVGLEKNRVYFIADPVNGYTLSTPQNSKRLCFRVTARRLPEELWEKLPGDYSLQYDKQHKMHYIEWA